ncbi:hypothetical protein SS1G_09024 [Sclerotinia sclerotiorum 1980 UF-70]|uniref:PINIT domain-containing protein n=1 Tax=Sclerotinia sclerotiorum (strain ATCC 18683 / 1980 / Ss-1) TaxID=665079 RepID=A7EUL7_SCLS1|nr:hypothetical protein SS1G_09024 [Sclerotinia sclerotiorum 1980 UF-70]EDN93159.1 hypothetical protein SS1G_09024 [Sclerotinia sclerotiorum 1980 UF-70]
MASMGGGGFLDPEPYVRKVKNGGMLNSTLKSICSAEDMRTQGVKAELQSRIVDRIRFYANAQDEPKFNRLRRIIDNPETVTAGVNPPRSYQNSASPAANSIPNNGATNYPTPRASMPSYNRPMGYGMKLEFKPSPFYDIMEQIGEIKTCDAMNQHRHTVNIPVKVQSHPILSRVMNDPTLKVMVFCAGEGNGRQDIAFPHQSEIKVNTGEIKANLRGLKNKPGSTRPVDITKELRLKVPGYQNTVEMTYALTTKAGLNGAFVASEKFYLAIYVVRLVPVKELVKILEVGKKITKESVVNDKQGPTWSCPICNSSAPFETLVVDEYVKNILQSTSKSVDQVTVEPEGQWKLYNRPDTISSRPGVASSDFSDDDDDDLIELSPGGRKASTPITRTGTGTSNSIGIQAQSARDSLSAAPSSRPNPLTSSTGAKRQISEVIDLCSSDDEEESPARPPPKKQFTSGSSGLNGAAPAFRPSFQNR